MSEVYEDMKKEIEAIAKEIERAYAGLSEGIEEVHDLSKEVRPYYKRCLNYSGFVEDILFNLDRRLAGIDKSTASHLIEFVKSMHKQVEHQVYLGLKEVSKKSI